MRQLQTYIYTFIALIIIITGLNSCTYYDPNFDNTPGALHRTAPQSVPYNSWVEQLRQTDQKRYQEYVLLRKHIDSNHTVVMNRVQLLQDSMMYVQYANNQQIILLRKEVHRLTQAVYLIIALILLGIMYMLFDTMKKQKRKRMAKTIEYKPATEEAVPAVILPSTQAE